MRETAEGGMKRRWQFLYSNDHWQDEKLYKVRTYSAANLTQACDKMLKFIRGRGWETTCEVQVDAEVYEFVGQAGHHISHYYDDHPLREFCG